MTTATGYDWRAVLHLQDGVLSRRQALELGLGEAAWRWRLATGRWQRLLPGVAAAHSGPVTAQQQAWAAVLYAGAGAALGGDVALVQAGMDLPVPVTLDLVVPAHRRVTSQPAAGGGPRLQVHRSAALAALVHPVLLPPRVRVAPAVLQAASWASSPRAAEWRVAAAVQQRVTSVTELRAALQKEPRLPRRALLLRVLDDVQLGAHAQSELDFLRLLRRNRLPPPDRCQLAVRLGATRYLDAWWERPRVAAEIDGVHHRSVRQWGADALRGNALGIAAGTDRVLLLRYTTGNLRHDEALVVAQLRAALCPVDGTSRSL